MCTEDSPSGLWRTLGKRVGCKPSGVRIPHPPPLAPEPIEVPGLLLLVAPPDLRPPRVLPAREPSAPRASLGASSRSPARPRRHPPAPRQVPPAPSTPAALVLLGLARPGPAATHRHRGRSLQTSGALRTGGTCGAVCTGQQSGGPELLSPGLVPLRLRGLRRSLHPGAQPGPRPSQRASSGAGPSRCSSIRPRTPSRSGAAMSRVRPPA